MVSSCDRKLARLFQSQRIRSVQLCAVDVNYQPRPLDSKPPDAENEGMKTLIKNANVVLDQEIVEANVLIDGTQIAAIDPACLLYTSPSPRDRG